MKWPEVTLDSCTRIVGGSTPKTDNKAYWDGDIYWVTPKDLSNLDSHYMDNTPRTITSEGLASCATEVLPVNSVLFSSRAPIGHVAINRVPMATNQGFKNFIPDIKKLDSKFLYHWLVANRAYLQSLGNGATFKEVSKSIVSRIKIPLPSLEEQRRIAAILDKADEVRDKRRLALEKLEGLAQAVFVEMFGEPGDSLFNWPVRCLGDVINDDDKINYGVVQPGEDVAEGVPLIRVGDLLDPLFDLDKVKKISSQIESAYSRSRLRGDEILVGCVGSIGAISVVHSDMKGANIARAVGRVPIDSTKANRLFIAAQLKTAKVQRYFKSETRTVAQPTLNIKQLIETKISIPPLELQNQFENVYSKIEKIKKQSKFSLAKSEEYFNSLQQRAFRGEL